MRDGAFASPSMPFYRKVTPAHVEHELRALVAKTVNPLRRPARVVGFKEVRFLERVEQDRPPADAFWDKDDRRGALRGYREGNATQRLAHFFRWLAGMLPALRVVLLTREPAAQARSAWFASNPNAAAQIARANALLERTLREPGMPRAFHVEHAALVARDEAALRALFDFVAEPYNRSCVLSDLQQKHSF